jgi:hypothetical protein
MIVVLPPEEYRELRDEVFVDQEGRCADCGNPVSIFQMELHHERGRGIGGGFRMDTKEETRGVCPRCHPKADRNKKSKWTGKDRSVSKSA